MSTSASLAADGRPDTTRHEQLSASAPLALVSAPQASFTVTTLADVVDASDGVLSLREAVDLANTTRGQDTITFAPALAGGTIRLTEGPLTITDALVIDGDPLDRGAGGIVIDGTRDLQMSKGDDAFYNAIRVDRANVRFEDLTITNSYGNGITATRADVAVHRVTITENFGHSSVAGIEARGGTLLVADSVIHDNAGEAGAAISMGNGARVTVQDSDLGHNTTNYSAGITGSGTLVVERSTIGVINGDTAAGIDIIGSARIADSTIAQIGSADTPVHGKAIRITGSLELINSTIADTGTGGTRYGHEVAALTLAPGAVATVTNTTITGTIGDASIGSGIGYGIGIGPRAVLRLANTIVDDVIAGPGTLTSNGGNLFRDTVVAHTQPDDVLGVTAQQIFAQTRPAAGGFRAGVLADNGGPTMTVALLDSESNPALNAARTNAAPGTDQRGFLRDALPDIGAFELDAGSVPPATLGPIAAADSFTIDGAALGKKSASLAILANDIAQSGKLVPKSVALAAPAAHGAASLKKGVLVYKPDPGFEGTEQLGYTVQDNDGRTSNVATVTIAVTQPVLTQAQQDSFTLDGARIGKNGARLAILANDTPGFGKLQPKSVAIVDGPENGTATVNKGTLLYKPEAGFEGADTITYTVADATGRASNPATVTLTVTQPPLPQAGDDSFTLDAARIGRNGAKLDILVNDMPGFGKLQPKSVAITEGPENGTVRLNKGALFYTPEPDFDGTDLIRYTVTDATGRASNEATVRVTVDRPASALLSADLLDDGPDLLAAPQGAAAGAPATAADLATLLMPADVA